MVTKKKAAPHPHRVGEVSTAQFRLNQPPTPANPKGSRTKARVVTAQPLPRAVGDVPVQMTPAEWNLLLALARLNGFSDATLDEKGGVVSGSQALLFARALAVASELTALLRQGRTVEVSTADKME